MSVTPRLRQNCEQRSAHHILDKVPFHSSDRARKISCMGTYIVGMSRLHHDYLHLVIGKPQIPTNRVLNALGELGREHSGYLPVPRLQRIASGLLIFANEEPSPQSADDAMVMVGHLTATAGLLTVFGGER